VALARLVADHYWVPLIECLRAMLPPRVRKSGSAGSGPSSRQRRHSRLLELANVSGTPATAAQLTGEQAAALEVIGGNPATLLHGVIASGKTEVYLAAAEQALAQGLRVLLLVPDISLTPQLVERVRQGWRRRSRSCRASSPSSSAPSSGGGRAEVRRRWSSGAGRRYSLPFRGWD